MEQLKMWALSLCFAAVVGCIANMIAPGGSMEKLFKLCVSVFLVCAMVSPFVKDNLSLHFQVQGLEDVPTAAGEYEEVINAQTQAALRVKLEQITREKLEKIPVEIEKISIKVNTDETGSICISEFQIYLDSKDEGKTEEIKRVVRDEIGMEPMLSFTGEENETQ